MESGPVQPCQHVDGCSFRQEVENHLSGDLAWICTDSLFCDSVVRGKDVGGFADGLGKMIAANSGDLGGEVLKTPQAAKRLGQGVEVLTRLLARLLARRFNTIDELFNEGSAHIRLHDSLQNPA